MSKFITVAALFLTVTSLFAGEELTSQSLPETDDFIVYDFPRGGIYTMESSLYLMTGRTLRFFPRKPVGSVEECAQRMASLKAEQKFESEHWFWDYNLAKWRHDLDCKIFFLIRDPRDVCISFLEYILEGNDIGNLADENWFGTLTQEEQISIIITHIHGGGISPQIRDRCGWKYMPNTLTVKYENLIGPQGGGSYEEQLKELRRMADHINLQITDEELSNIAGQIYGHTPERFHMGNAGIWKSYFTDHHKELFKKHLGDVLIELGYEQDLYW